MPMVKNNQLNKGKGMDEHPSDSPEHKQKTIIIIFIPL